MSCVDGTFRFISRSGREEKKVDAHNGAIIVIRWSQDGSTLLTAGEDGDVKIWSKSGNLRSCLASLGQSVFCACWGPDGDQVLFGNGQELMIRSVQASKKNLQWKAHDGIVLCVDWNVANGTIISGGEDCTYKVWDSFGRQLYSSRPLEHVVTSIRWNPNGDHFAVGSFNVIRLCDKSGWSHCREKVSSGSILSIAWTPDGTQFACSTGNNSVVFAQIVDRKFEWKDSEVILIDPRKLRVQDVTNESVEDLDFSRDRIVEIGIGFDHLVVTTTTQCFIYNLQNLNTPIIFDIKAPPHFIHLCHKHFLTLDQISGVHIISFEGKLLSAPKCPGLRPEFLTKDMISLSPDTLSVVDSVDPKNIQILDSVSGRNGGRFVHSGEVVAVFLNQHNVGPTERMLAFIDRNRDLFVTSVNIASLFGGGNNTSQNNSLLSLVTFKLLSHIESCIFNDETNVLVGLADSCLKFWFQPDVVFVDKDLLPYTMSSVDAVEYGRGAQILSYTNNRVSVRKQDGSVLFTASTSDIPLLYELTRAGRWEEATRLCRHQKTNYLWATLASMALSKKQLDTAEISLAELNEVTKVFFNSFVIFLLFLLIFLSCQVEYVQVIKQIPSEDGRHAEMSLLRRKPDEAERVLLQATPPLLYRAIKMNISIFRWGRALDLAVKHKIHIDTVLAYRQQYLVSFQREEHDPKFVQQFSKVSNIIYVFFAFMKLFL